MLFPSSMTTNFILVYSELFGAISFASANWGDTKGGNNLKSQNAKRLKLSSGWYRNTNDLPRITEGRITDLSWFYVLGLRAFLTLTFRKGNCLTFL